MEVIQKQLMQGEKFTDTDIKNYYDIPAVLKLGLICDRLTDLDVIFLKDVRLSLVYKNVWINYLTNYIKLKNKIELELHTRINSCYAL